MHSSTISLLLAVLVSSVAGLPNIHGQSVSAGHQLAHGTGSVPPLGGALPTGLGGSTKDHHPCSTHSKGSAPHPNDSPDVHRRSVSMSAGHQHPHSTHPGGALPTGHGGSTKHHHPHSTHPGGALPTGHGGSTKHYHPHSTLSEGSAPHPSNTLDVHPRFVSVAAELHHPHGTGHPSGPFPTGGLPIPARIGAPSLPPFPLVPTTFHTKVVMTKFLAP